MSKININNLKINDKVLARGRKAIIISTRYLDSTVRVRYLDNNDIFQVNISEIFPRKNYLKENHLAILAIIVSITALIVGVLK